MSASPFAPHTLMADPAYPRLKDYLIASTGLAYYVDKDRDLAGYVGSRLTKVGVSNCEAYLALLLDGSSGHIELDALIENLTIGETFFFRHRELFDALRSIVLPHLIARNVNTRQLRIWSAGCSTGAEAYSLSILLRRDLGSLLTGWDVTIVGTDINREFLARAREGVFETWTLRNTPEVVKQSCFSQEGNSWRLMPEFRVGVSFQYHNLVAHPFPSLLNNLFAFDLILCRNVTIYFNVEIIRRLVEHFHQTLVEDGWLLVGHAEPNIELFRSFRTVNAPGAVLYQKSKETIPLPPWFVEPSPLSTIWVPPVLPEFNTLPCVQTVGPSRTASTPEAPSSRSELDAIRTLADRGEWDRAAANCQAMLDRDRLNPVVHFYQALVMEQTGHHGEAERALRRVIYLDRTFVLGHYYLGLLLQKTGQMTQASRSFNNVLKLLERIDAETVFPDGDGITAGEMRNLTHMHLEVLDWSKSSGSSNTSGNP